MPPTPVVNRQAAAEKILSAAFHIYMDSHIAEYDFLITILFLIDFLIILCYCIIQVGINASATLPWVISIIL